MKLMARSVCETCQTFSDNNGVPGYQIEFTLEESSAVLFADSEVHASDGGCYEGSHKGEITTSAASSVIFAQLNDPIFHKYALCIQTLYIHVQ